MWRDHELIFFFYFKRDHELIIFFYFGRVQSGEKKASLPGEWLLSPLRPVILQAAAGKTMNMIYVYTIVLSLELKYDFFVRSCKYHELLLLLLLMLNVQSKVFLEKVLLKNNKMNQWIFSTPSEAKESLLFNLYSYINSTQRKNVVQINYVSLPLGSLALHAK